jgi:hypothetical protein
MTMPKALRLLIGLHLALGLIYDWATPIFEAPDEGYHFAVIRWIAQGNGLPEQDPSVRQDWEQEGSQPPLYHALAAGLTFWVDTGEWEETFVFNPHSRIGIPNTTHNVNLYRHTAREQFPYRGTPLAVHLTRWLSLFISVGVIVLTHRLSMTVFPGQPNAALLAAALVALNPKALFINASVNNDNLLMLLSTASLLATIHLMQTNVMRFEWKAIGLGTLLGLAALTKVSGLVLWPIAAMGVGWGAWRARSWRRFLIGGLLVGGAALLISGWWFWRNQALYGELLGLNTMVAIAGPRVPPITLWTLIRDEWYGFYRSYWDVFGVFTILPTAWVQWAFDALTLWAIAGGLWLLARRRAAPRPEALLLALFCLLTLVGVTRWTMMTFASQGRLMFGALAPLSIFMALGLLVPFERRRLESWTVNLGICFLTLIAIVTPIAYIAPRYAPPPFIAEADLPADLQSVRATFGEALELIGYTDDTAPLTPGQSQRVTLYWRALQPASRDYALALHLLGRGRTAEVGKIDTWPGGGLAPTSQLPSGAIFADTYLIPVTTSAEAPSLLWLDVDVWDATPEDTLSVSVSGAPVESLALRIGRIIPAEAPPASPMLPLNLPFEYGITLLGMDSGANGAFTLYWQTTQPAPGNFTVFAHLLDASGSQVAQADSPPLNNDWPTSAWIPDLTFADPRQFDVAGLRPGQYTVRLGFYEPASGARVAAFQPDGARWPDDAVVIENVIEIK